MAKSEYVPVENKIKVHEDQKTALMAQLNDAPEDQKAGIQEQINEQDRKIRWYQGRQKSPKFQARAAQAQSAPVTEEQAPAPVDPTPANVANQS